MCVPAWLNEALTGNRTRTARFVDGAVQSFMDSGEVVDHKKGSGNCTAEKFEKREEELCTIITEKHEIPAGQLVAVLPLHDNAGV